MSRVGWSTSDSPDLVFRPVLGRTRKEKGKSGTELLVANDIANVEAVRFNLKTPFDRNVVTQGDYQVKVSISVQYKSVIPLSDTARNRLKGGF